MKPQIICSVFNLIGDNFSFLIVEGMTDHFSIQKKYNFHKDLAFFQQIVNGLLL